MAVRPLVIVHMGYPPADIRARVGDQPQWFRQALGQEGELHIVRPFLGEALPDVRAIRGAVISGSWSMVTEREGWSERTADWVLALMAQDTPLLGVCYGHQLMADALGGTVDYNPRGSETGCQAVVLNANAQSDPLLKGLPTRFNAFLSHAQSVLALPPGATALGASELDAMQIIRYSARAFSVQFHPEFTPQIMHAIIESRSERLAEHADVARLLADCEPTPQSLGILQRFGAFCRQTEASGTP